MYKAHDYAPAEVVGSVMLGEQMKRLFISGPHVARLLEQSLAFAPGAWIKIKVAGESGRAYTIVEPNPRSGCLALDIALHSSSGSDDCISDWAIRAEIGARLDIAGPRSGGFTLAQDVGWLLLIGDLSAIPALRSIAKASVRLPIFLITEGLMKQQLTELQMINTNTVAMPLGADRIKILHQLIKEHPILGDQCGQAWIAGEASMMKTWKTFLVNQGHIRLKALTGKGYWRRGVSDHRDESP